MRKVLLAVCLSFVIYCLFVVSPAHAQVYTNEKLITVDLGSQKVTAWKDGQIQYTAPAATGMYLTPTVRGSFRIYAKVPIQDMRGPSPYKNIYPSGRYYIKNVPYVMYFYQGYAIHGNYWRTYFGSRGSHGCVGVAPVAAEWLYNFADVGTRVEVF